MSKIVLHYDLSPVDYSADNVEHAWRGSVLPAICVAEFVVIAACILLEYSVEESLVYALIIGLLTFVTLPFYQLRRIKKYFRSPKRMDIYGPDSLTLADDGFESVCPSHRIWRSWKQLAYVENARHGIHLITNTGNTYVIPAKAISDRANLLAFIEERQKSAEKKPLAGE